MRISELFRKNILETGVGGVVNKLRIKKRRNSLFFGDIFIGYVRECEESGYSKEMMDIGRKWMFLYFGQLVPGTIKKLPLPILSRIMKRVWINVGLMEDFNIKMKNGMIEIETRKEAITGTIGRNQFSVGLFMGICNSLFDSGIDVVKVSQTRNLNRYVFRKDRNRKFRIRSKGKKTYDRLNCLKPVKGFTLHEALERKIFQLRGNRIYFRGGSVYTVESTLFHLVGEKKILADRIPEISYNFFRRVIDSKTTVTRKLGLIKILLQTMGWGVVKILERKKKIIFEIRNPPFGLQMERDNWIFLVNAVLGYLWILDKGFKLESAKHQGKLLEVVYSKP
ncbi:MAG: hypothetical protein GTN38_01680 [Candidatus Aenigmarchaeota archaeon]|nr:hypothetical protein [Candidatus Aenigmarchaeota archaeon]NIQ17290.1 hypothetical protein [Candidatus Aenigmarchaeota archaeon]NIS73151.1 hypothetical protein [Candidatus Aenigmarchaeota archaeon]